MKSDQQSKDQKRERKPREKSIVISFRLSESAYEPFKLPVEKSGLARSEFFRQLFSDSTEKIVVSEKKTATEDYNQYLHLVNKISNNINQLARLINGAEKSGKVTSQQYIAGLNNLNSMRLLLLAKLGRKE